MLLKPNQPTNQPNIAMLYKYFSTQVNGSKHSCHTRIVLFSINYLFAHNFWNIST